jgi:aminoglycoside phosphotransferase (APT) family kinase protein
VLAEIVTSHEERAVVRVGDVFVKVDTVPDRVRREVTALRSLESVPLPALLWERRGTPHLLAVSEVPGRPLAELGAPSDRSPAAWAAAGAMARILHEQPVPTGLDGPSRYLLGDVDELERWLVGRGLAEEGVLAHHATRARAALAVAGGGGGETLVHGDLQAAHVFVAGDESVSGVIDWGDAGLGDPLYDLAVLTVGHREQLDHVVAGYGRDVDRTRIEGYWSWRRLGSVRWMIEHGFDASGDIAALTSPD